MNACIAPDNGGDANVEDRPVVPKREVAITSQDETRPTLYSGASALIVHKRSAAAEYWYAVQIFDYCANRRSSSS